MDEPSSSQESHISLQQRPNPRRKPAHESVSLKRGSTRLARVPTRPLLSKTALPLPRPDGSSSSSMDVDAASNSSLVAEHPSICQKQSSGESTNPEKWFEDSNNHMKSKNPAFSDNEPPFFLRNSSSENTPPEVLAQRSREQAQGVASLDLLSREDHSSEGFRSVIDDLTIENKRLKRQLRRHGRLRDSLSHAEALFEVRVHGLPPDKKHELEEMLRNFVSKLDATPRSSTNISSGRDGIPSSLRPDLTWSSTSHNADSGYASLSASGQNSGDHSGKAGATQQAPDQLTNQDRRKDIQSYLSDIPAGLLPYQMGPMSDVNKKKIVVRRLEQLFAGRDPSGAHQQPIQQEKVAQSAARADRKATVPLGTSFQEGSREARIMRKNKDGASKLPASRSAENSGTRTSNVAIKAEYAGVSSEDDQMIEQRPTRPLDLDPYRAQIPSENMQYMRHLGFSPPHSDSMSEHEDGHGWIYLNVLYNMAQLHLANVPMEYVRKSVNEHSKMLELSPDGRKLRWKGGHGVSRLSSSNSPTEESQSRRTLDGSKSSHQTSESSGPGRVYATPNKFAYSPLFHREDSNSTDAGADDDRYQISNIPAASSIPASSSGIAGGRSRADDAPIIFYQNTAFYTDLSGDSGVRGGKLSSYHKVSFDPVGSKKDLDLDQLRNLQNEKGPLSHPITFPSELHKPVGTPSSGSLQVLADNNDSSSSPNTSDPMDFEASGLGGVFPADNFAISVRSRQNMGKRQEGSETPGKARQQSYPTSIRRALQKVQLSKVPESSPILTQSKNKSIIQREIIASKTHELPASKLPEGTYFHNSSDEEDDEDDDMMDYESDEDISSLDDIPMTAPQRIDWATVADSRDDDDEDNAEDDSDGDSDESMDLLASARHYDPEAVRHQEREFASNIADGLADEIPAGSSAATAEGGSGFNSPTAGVVNAMAAANRRMPTLKRARKSDDSDKLRDTRRTKSPKIDAGPSK